MLMVAALFVLILPVPAGTGEVLELIKTGPDSAQVGETITYDFEVKNNELVDPLENAVVTDPMFGAGWSKSLGTITAGGSKSFSQTYTVKATDPNPLVNTAKVDGRMGGADTWAYGNCSVNITGGANPGLSVAKTGPMDALMYETITYTIAVMNNGNVPLTNVWVSDSLVSDFHWDVGNLGVGEGDYRHVKYTVTPDSPYPLKNMAYGHGDSEAGEVHDNSVWTVKTSGMFAKQWMSNACTRVGYQTSVGIYNSSDQYASTSVTYNGTGGNSYNQSTVIPPQSRTTINANDTPDMPPGDYSVVVESDQPVAASATTYGVYSEELRGAYGMSSNTTGNKFYFPNVCTRSIYYGYISVVNSSGDYALTRVAYYGTGGNSYQQEAAVPPNARYTFGAQDVPDMPSGDYSAVVESDQPIAVSQSTFCAFDGQYPVAYGSAGTSEASLGNKYYLPNICTQAGYQTYTGVFNASSDYASVKSTYYGISGDSYEQSAVVPPSSRYTFCAQDFPGMPPGDYSAVIESDQPIAVSQATFGNFKGWNQTAYGADGMNDLAVGTEFYLPNVNTNSRYYSYVAVQSLGDATANVTATYYGTGMNSYQQSGAAPPNGRLTFGAHDTPGMPPGYYSAVIKSDQPIIVSQSTFGPGFTRGMVYSGCGFSPVEPRR